MLFKKEAAEYLGISSRTLERHVKDGKIGVRYQPGATNDVAMFDEQDLENFKNERQTPRIKPTVALRQNTTKNLQDSSQKRILSFDY